jgi:muramoyltetrapeptide carboxypeptidase
MELLRPKAIEPGMTLGVVSPSSAIEAEDLEKGLEPFYQRGYKIVLGEYALARRGYLAGTDEQRARDLMAMFARDDVDAVLCSRGGYGAARLIPYLDPAVFRNHPKLLIGYSDITVLHLWLLRQVGLVGLYAPMPITMTRPIPDHAMEVFWRALEVPEPLGELPPWNAPYRTIVPGKAQGRITGGCLCLMADSIGTPYELDTRDAIVIIEDVDEPPYRLDAMLNHLALAGKWAVMSRNRLQRGHPLGTACQGGRADAHARRDTGRLLRRVAAAVDGGLPIRAHQRPAHAALWGAGGAGQRARHTHDSGVGDGTTLSKAQRLPCR